MDKNDNPFDILGVDENADESTIKKVYFKLARQYHPDKQETEEDKLEMGSKFAKISDVYNLLTDPVRRQAWEQKKEEREARQRSKSPRFQAQRRDSGRRSPPNSPGSLRKQRPKQHPMFNNMPQRNYSPNRSPPRNIRTKKRSVSPMPPSKNSSSATSRGNHQQSPRLQRPRKPSLSPKRRGSTTRRTTSPVPPPRRHQSPGAYRQSPGRQSPGRQSPGRLRRKFYNPSASLQTPSVTQKPPPGVRRASSSGLANSPPMATFFANLQDEEDDDAVLPRPRSCPRASWTSSNSIITEDIKKEKNKEKSKEKSPFEKMGLHPFEVLGLKPVADKVEILTAYRALAFEYRPTKKYSSENEKQEAARQMARVSWAYESLKDPEQLQEWKEKCSTKPSSSTNSHDLSASERFHDSVSSIGSWGLFRNTRDKSSANTDDDDDDDDDSFIGNDQQQVKSGMTKSRGRKLSNRRTEAASISPKASPKTSPKGGIKKKVALLSALGFPKNRRNLSPKRSDKRRSSLFSSLTSNKNASPVSVTEEEVPTKIVTDDNQNEQPVKKLKKKKKKKKVLTLSDDIVSDEKLAIEPTKKLKKKRKKKKRPKSPNPVDFTWKREESKLVIVKDCSTSNRTAHETVEGSSVASLGDEESPVVVSAN